MLRIGPHLLPPTTAVTVFDVMVPWMVSIPPDQCLPFVRDDVFIDF
jgi:hypothetical protein